MRKDRDSRRPQRPGFDEDNYLPPRDFGFAPRQSGPTFGASSPGQAVQATVKWYNPEKGFGFVGLPTGGDAFLHVSVVERNGGNSVLPGATLEVRAGPGPKGPQVTEILSVDTSTASQEQRRRERPERAAYQQADRTSVEEHGTVKWYNSTKGFGFIVRDGGGKDLFMHASALQRSGLADLAEGQRVAADVTDGQKGPDAVGLRLI